MPGFNMILYISTDKQHNMKTKKIITLLLIIAIFCSITAVSAGWFDFLSGGEKQDEEQTESVTTDDLLINSTTVVKYSNVTKSDSYAWYSQDSGEYVGDAYYAPYSVNCTLKIDIEKLYKYQYNPDLHKENYTLEDFKKDLNAENEKNNQVANVMEFEITNGAKKSIIIGSTDCYIDNESNILTINFHQTTDEYQTESQVSDNDVLKNATTAQCELRWGIETNLTKDPTKEPSDINKVYFEGEANYELPVTCEPY